MIVKEMTKRQFKNLQHKQVLYFLEEGKFGFLYPIKTVFLREAATFILNDGKKIKVDYDADPFVRYGMTYKQMRAFMKKQLEAMNESPNN